MTDQYGYQGTQRPGTAGGDYNAHTFLAQSIVNRINSCTLVQVVAVTNAGALSPVGFVDVQPLVNQLDGSNNQMPHAVVFGIPYFRLQGGTDAIIIDPKVGDIGIAVFADHDISSVKANKAQANPGSMRRFSLSDGLYIGGVLNGTPVQYIRYSAAGIEMVSPTKVTISAPLVEIDASTSLTVSTPAAGYSGTITAAGEIVAVSTPVHSHVHGGVTPGAADTSGPIP